ncbi:MAG: transposase [Lutibacter sp.]|nr:transposase [Lutibacter sp.]
MGFVRKHLSADGLLRAARHSFYKEALPEYKRSDISWQDCIMSGLAIFGLKFPSLLKFEEGQSDSVTRRNLKNLYHINIVPSDTCFRERLDELSPKNCRRAFKTIFAFLQRGKMLERYLYFDKYYLMSVDGTGQFSSKNVHCKNCCEKHHQDGTITYYHQMLGASIVHPDERVVIPLAPEAIVNGDGDTKNDCERNASKRLLKDFRREHPHLKVIVIEDALASNYPHLSLLDSLKIHYIIGAKPGDHKFLFDWIKHAKANEIVVTRNKIQHKFRYVNNVPLNDANYDYKVNVIEYWEEKPNGKKQRFSWVTSFTVTDKNVFDLMRAARARWKIENETFNTLKNQGYNFEHNYGHGNNNLCSVMAMLMLLAFLIDQVQWLCCDFYKKVKEKERTWYSVFEKIRSMFQIIVWDNWVQMYELVIDPRTHPPPNWFGKSITVEQ